MSSPATVPNENPSSTPSALPIEAKIDLGVIVKGESTTFQQWVSNKGDKPVLVANIYTSCECVNVRLSKSQIAPSERVIAQCSYDGKKAPDFLGSLLIEITLYDENGNKVGRIEVPLEVIAHLGTTKPHPQ